MLMSGSSILLADIMHPRLLASVQGARPLIFLAQHRGIGVRIAYIPEGGKQSLKQGLHLKADRSSPIVGLATHPSRAQIYTAAGI